MHHTTFWTFCACCTISFHIHSAMTEDYDNLDCMVYSFTTSQNWGDRWKNIYFVLKTFLSHITLNANYNIHVYITSSLHLYSATYLLWNLEMNLPIIFCVKWYNHKFVNNNNTAKVSSTISYHFLIMGWRFHSMWESLTSVTIISYLQHNKYWPMISSHLSFEEE